MSIDLKVVCSTVPDLAASDRLARSALRGIEGCNPGDVFKYRHGVTHHEFNGEYLIMLSAPRSTAGYLTTLAYAAATAVLYHGRFIHEVAFFPGAPPTEVLRACFCSTRTEPEHVWQALLQDHPPRASTPSDRTFGRERTIATGDGLRPAFLIGIETDGPNRVLATFGDASDGSVFRATIEVDPDNYDVFVDGTLPIQRLTWGAVAYRHLWDLVKDFLMWRDPHDHEAGYLADE